MARIADWAEALALSLGGPGLFFVAFLDSSFLSLPEINDLLVILLVIRHKERMAYYALMATLGSITGCFVLYYLGRKGGDALLRKRFQGPRAERALRRRTACRIRTQSRIAASRVCPITLFQSMSSKSGRPARCSASAA